MLESKDAEGFLRHFTGLARRLFAVPIRGQEKARPPAAIAELARRVGIPAESRHGIEDALAAVRRLDLEPPPRVLLTGSLYLAGEALMLNGTPPT
jgi:dihydrofolate synthase/folylpolyglutamate synthase